ncbi:MAG: hypothetical protein ACR2PU_00145 [Gammaproteobacteria bacterium]
MKTIIYFSVSFIFAWSTLVIAESNLVDIPQDELMDVYLDDQTKSNPSSVSSSNSEAAEITQAESDNKTIETVENTQSQDLEVIEIDNSGEEVVEVEAYTASNANLTSAQIFCRENPNAQECLYSEYLARCKKDPQSYACRDQLAKFNNFCATFPRAYKCKKANLAALCTREPNSNECKEYKKRYCQKYPKTEFCVWN